MSSSICSSACAVDSPVFLPHIPLISRGFTLLGISCDRTILNQRTLKKFQIALLRGKSTIEPDEMIESSSLPSNSVVRPLKRSCSCLSSSCAERVNKRFHNPLLSHLKPTENIQQDYELSALFLARQFVELAETAGIGLYEGEQEDRILPPEADSQADEQLKSAFSTQPPNEPPALEQRFSSVESSNHSEICDSQYQQEEVENPLVTSFSPAFYSIKEFSASPLLRPFTLSPVISPFIADSCLLGPKFQFPGN
jgi:hypothetical protein